MNALQGWQNFYVIVGSGGAALTGLQFIVITLMTTRPIRRDSRALAAFGTPQVVHFCGALLIAVVACAPWTAIWGFAIAIGVTGAVGVAYMIVIVRHAVVQTGYKPVFEDWLWHHIFPFLAYGALVVSAFLVGPSAATPLFVIAASAVLLVFVGIHNAWDTVTYMLLMEDSPHPPPS